MKIEFEITDEMVKKAFQNTIDTVIRDLGSTYWVKQEIANRIKKDFAEVVEAIIKEELANVVDIRARVKDEVYKSIRRKVMREITQEES